MSAGQGKILSPGNIIQDKWVVLEFIGKGAFGEVYRAHQLNLQRDVAIKVVSQEWLKSQEIDPDEIDTALQRFRREGRAMARVHHLNILQIFDHGSVTIKKGNVDYPLEFIVMEYIPGETLRHTMSEEGFYPEEELIVNWLQDYFLPVLDGVMAIHALDITHRDLKPENILVDGLTPKIADFGLARSSRLKPVTQSMEVKGTAHYMSPEHFFDFRKADHRADIYSLGKILFEAIDGKISERNMPFKTVSVQNPDTPFFQKLDRIIQDATAEKKEDRLESVDQLRRELLDAIRELKFGKEADLSAKPGRLPVWYKPKWIGWGVMIAIIAVAAMTIWHLIGNPGKSPVVLETPPAISEDSTQTDRRESSGLELAVPDVPKQSILAEDGASLHFVSAGVVSLPEGPNSQLKRSVKVNPFYMDETLVTNHQYVEFLNQNLSRIRVEGDVVRGEDNIWLLLGEVTEGYVPIVYQDGKFKVNKIAYASLPLLRVTAYGALSYASFYNRDLPTYTEWLLALGDEDDQFKEPVTGGAADQQDIDMASMHRKMQTQITGDVSKPKYPGTKITSVIDYQPNKYGIRGLNKNIKEWGLMLSQATSKDKISDAHFVILPSTVQRNPWEAFEEVGFRCVRKVKIKAK